MKVVLLDAAADRDMGEFARALRDEGHDVAVVSSPRIARAADALLVRRGFEDHLMAIPWALRGLRGADVAHAFTLADAYAAIRAQRPLVLSLTQAVSRDTVAARRTRLKLVKTVLSSGAALTAPDAAVAASAERWLGVSPQVLDPACDAAGFSALYRALAER